MEAGAKQAELSANQRGTRAAQQVSQNLQSLSVGTGEMTSTIQSIAKDAQEAAKVASTAVHAARAANASVAKFGGTRSEGLALHLLRHPSRVARQ